MELVLTRGKDEIKPIDSEVLNSIMHMFVLTEANADRHPNQELLALGLSKGSVVMLHVKQLNQVYCRFTIHREAIVIIKYLPKTKMFVSFCTENNLKVWRVQNKERKV